MTEFDSSFFAGNRRKLRISYKGDGLIVVTANGLLQRSRDDSFEFYQDRHFWYLTGIDEPDVVLVMDKTDEYIIVPHRDEVREHFDGAINTEALKNVSGVAHVLSADKGWRRLEESVQRSNTVATLTAFPPYIEAQGLYANPARERLIARLKVANPKLEITNVGQELARLRMIKQPQELAALQRSIDITIDTMNEVFNELQKYTYEYEIEADLSAGFRKRGARGHAFAPIIASGKNGCTLHYLANNDALNKNELVVMDVGARADFYAADITRTCSLSTPTPRQIAVHQAVQAAQQYAFSLLKPGVVLHDYEKKVEAFIGQELIKLGLISKLDPKEIRNYFPHGTSHFLGLDTHDVGDYDAPLEPGMVITVEPGIYIPEEGIGVRIEDDVLITKTGNQNLSERLSRKLL